MKKALIVEDDSQIAELVELHLKDNYFTTTRVATGSAAIQSGLDMDYDVIILDIMLPDISGLEVCRMLRAANVNTPVMMLTARSEEIDKILGLETGADDYLTKPFSIREFLARIKALMRRAEMKSTVSATAKDIISFGELNVDLGKRKVTLRDKKIELTPKEFDLLSLFITHPGRSYSREALLNQIWGYEYGGYEHTVNAHINRLRTKIEPDLANPVYILTTWGVGYRFNDEWT
jgi:DNA-binding response OmpR family regulator